MTIFFASYSLELRNGVALSLEGTVGDVGAVVVHVWHDWLRHGAVPLHVAWLSEDVSPGGLVVLMVDWGLTSSPFSVCVGHWWVLWKHASHVPVEQVWVVGQGLGVEGVVVQNDWAVGSKTAAETSNNKPHAPDVGEAASSVEVFDWQFTDNGET